MPGTLELVFWVAALGGAGAMLVTVLLGAAGHAALHTGAHHGAIGGGHGHAALGDGGGHGHAALGHGGPHAGHLHLGHGPHAHAADAGGAHGHAHPGDGGGFDWNDVGALALSYLNPAALTLSLCYFGLCGLLLHSVFHLWPVLSVVAAAVFGVALAQGTGRLVLRTVSGGMVSSDIEVRELVGQLGEVSTAIPAKGLGEIAIVVGGTRAYYPARAETEIPRGTRVFLEQLEDGVAYVSPFDELPQPPSELER